MYIKYFKTDDIFGYEDNAKKHPEDQVEKIANSIDRFGFKQPIVIDRNNIVIVGHGRLLGAKKLGLDKVPCLVADDLSEDEIKAYRLADNKLNESGWDDKLVQEELKLLPIELVELTGFELEQILEPEERDDAVPDVPEEPKAKLGDIYQLGNHRLMCGDSTSIDDVEKLMDGNKADMVFTDPPYNVAFNGRSGKFDVIKNDKLKTDEFNNFINGFLSVLNILEIETYYICCNWAFYGILQNKLKPKACIVWAKNVFGLGSGYRHQHEFILFNGYINPEIKNETDLWNIAKDHNYVHPTQKPVEISQRSIINSSNKGDKILDLFGGSGSTLIACEKTNRKCYMMELDPKYIDVIIKRWEDYTGEKAVLLGG